MLQKFGSKADALQRRGFEVYSPRRSLRYRFNEWRFNRRGGADDFLLPLPPLVPIPLDEALANEAGSSPVPPAGDKAAQAPDLASGLT